MWFPPQRYGSYFFCLFVRIFAGLFQKTYLDPDEFWQGAEVGHHLAFGYGYTSWEWVNGVRGYLHPLFFYMPFKLMGLLGVDSPLLVSCAPTIMQACWAAYGDILTLKFARKAFGSQGRWVLLLLYTSCGSLLYLSRPYSNSFEAVFVMVSFVNFPCLGGSSRRKAIVFVVISFIIRPSSALLTVIPILAEYFDPAGLYLGRKISARTVAVHFSECITVLLSLVSLGSVLDRLFSGWWYIASNNFFKFNFLSSGSESYGIHHRGWYVDTVIPLLLGTQIVLILSGFLGSFRETRRVGTAKDSGNGRSYLFRFRKMLSPTFIIISSIIFKILVLETQNHKETRFLLPIIYPFYALTDRVLEKTLGTPEKMRRYALWIFGMCVFIHISGFSYLSLVHQRAPMDVMRAIRSGDLVDVENRRTRIDFLMTCHSTPLFSEVHRQIDMRFLDCPPKLTHPHVTLTEMFIEDPLDFVQYAYCRASSERSSVYVRPTSCADLPDLIIVYEGHYRLIGGFLESLGYSILQQWFNGHYEQDPNRPGNILGLSRNVSV